MASFLFARLDLNLEERIAMTSGRAHLVAHKTSFAPVLTHIQQISACFQEGHEDKEGFSANHYSVQHGFADCDPFGSYWDGFCDMPNELCVMWGAVFRMAGGPAWRKMFRGDEPDLRSTYHPEIDDDEPTERLYNQSHLVRYATR